MTDRLRRPSREVRRSRQAGAGLVESIIVFPTLLFMVLAMMQAAMVFYARSNVNYASYEAARAATVNNASAASINLAFQRALLPYYGGGRTNTELVATVEKVAEDFRNTAVRVEILSPSQESFTDYNSPLLQTRWNTSAAVIPNVGIDALAVFVAVFLGVVRIVHSPYGQVLKAIRENEPRAVSLGYDVDRYKLLAFVLSASLAGLAGSMKVLVLGFATLSDAHWSLSGEVILMTLLGGLGTFAGPVIGAATIIGLQDALSDRVGSWVNVIIGVIFVVCVVAFRKGFVGELLAWQQRRRAAKRA